jgi:hypothetical protein
MTDARAARQLHLFKGKRQRGQRVDVSPSEFQLHCQVADTLERWRSANWVSTHFPAGEERPSAAGARLKRMGLRAGLPDFLLFPPQDWPELRTHFLELKRRGGRLSDAQVEFEFWARANHYPFQIADTYELALATLQQWGAVRTGIKAQ